MEYNQLDSYEWLGLFKYPDGSLEFPGKLTYSHGEIRLEFMCSTKSSITETSYLHGTLADGRICTLVGKFDPRNAGAAFGTVSIYKGGINFQYVILGKHITPDQRLFSGIWLNFNLLQDFCFPQGFKKNAEFYSEPIHSCKNEELEVAIVMEGNFESVTKWYANRFISDDKEVLNKIMTFFSELIEHSPRIKLDYRTETQWRLRIDTTKKEDAQRFIDLGNLMSELFSILLARPVHFIELSLKEDKENDEFRVLPLLINMPHLNKENISFLKKSFPHEFMPITLRTINLSSIFSEWFKISNKYSKSNFIRKIRYDFNSSYYTHQIQAEFVLLLTQLEDIRDHLSEEKGIKKEKYQKYNLPIEFYDKSSIKETLNYLLKLEKNTENIGEKLSALRNEIAHLARPRTELKKLSDLYLLCICKCLDIIIISHIYSELTISYSVIKKFQENQLQTIQKNFSNYASSKKQIFLGANSEN